MFLIFLIKLKPSKNTSSPSNPTYGTLINEDDNFMYDRSMGGTDFLEYLQTRNSFLYFFLKIIEHIIII